jgi:predicted SAM-dependent methyltransferase
LSDETTYLNLGCGNRYHPKWINIDIAPQGPEVIQHDLRRGIPLSDASCDVVYHAAVLEHMRRSDATTFLVECHRVLKPGGIMRVGVPDLEKICQIYLSRLASAINCDEKAAQDYDWIMLELYDQAVRERSGGDMLDYLRHNPLKNETFIYERIGEEGYQLVKSLQLQDKRKISRFPNSLHGIPQRFRSLLGVAKRGIPKWLLGNDDKQALEIGRFRMAGELHQWMYDRYSLAKLLRLSGFCDPQLQDAKSSRIPNWVSYHLDTMSNGKVIKPDLFFMEAIKPESPDYATNS